MCCVIVQIKSFIASIGLKQTPTTTHERIDELKFLKGLTTKAYKKLLVPLIDGKPWFEQVRKEY